MSLSSPNDPVGRVGTTLPRRWTPGGWGLCMCRVVSGREVSVVEPKEASVGPVTESGRGPPRPGWDSPRMRVFIPGLRSRRENW